VTAPEARKRAVKCFRRDIGDAPGGGSKVWVDPCLGYSRDNLPVDGPLNEKVPRPPPIVPRQQEPPREAWSGAPVPLRSGRCAARKTNRKRLRYGDRAGFKTPPPVLLDCRANNKPRSRRTDYGRACKARAHSAHLPCGISHAGHGRQVQADRAGKLARGGHCPQWTDETNLFLCFLRAASARREPCPLCIARWM